MENVALPLSLYRHSQFNRDYISNNPRLIHANVPVRVQFVNPLVANITHHLGIGWLIAMVFLILVFKVLTDVSAEWLRYLLGFSFSLPVAPK